MSTTITIDPRELMDTAVLLGTSAVELADIGATLRTCTACAMPPEVRNSVDNLVAIADRIFDDMALQLRAEAANLAQRAIVAANDILTAAGYPPLPGTTTTPTPGPTVASGVSIIGGNTGADFTIVNPDGTPYVTPSTMTIGGGSGGWGPLVVASAGGANSSVGGSTSSPNAVVVGGSWTPSSLEITVTNPDGTPSGLSTEGWSARLSQSANTIPSRSARGPIDIMATNWAMQPLTNMMRNGIDYSVWATSQNNMGNTPPPQHQTTYRTGP